MAKILSIHSFRGGTGKSNIVANIAVLLAMEGQCVGVIDTDIQSPGIHVLFGLAGQELPHSLNDFLWGKCRIQQAAHDVTVSLQADIPGQVFLIPSSIQAGEIAKVLREGYDTQLLTEGIRDLIDELQLDVLLIDTHPGLNEETLLSIVISDALAIIIRPDQQDYEGTGVTVEVARKLDVPRMLLIVNKVPDIFNAADVKARVEQAYACKVGAVLPLSNDMVALASSGIFAIRYPDHPITSILKDVAGQLIA
jgi:MinD-like ATPase involved in chromosome partitioning or flagellar assembly